ncbi:urease accessory protein UreD [Paracoccus sp. SCSIO 75233]|nr:urease accessory protein UreD [Paracoccus sp. SCSIO 75233]WBU52408.1 urease accessory protein UreD [Paracoccus sp. SCSIO 75233]
MIPRSYGPVPEIVFLNTSGGLTSDDELEYRLSIGPDMQITATTQTAERAYRAEASPAQAMVHITAAEGSSANWLPQETILFDGARLRRDTIIDLTGDAAFLGLETIVLGRAAMGENPSRLTLSDTRCIRRNGRLELYDPFRLDDAGPRRAGTPALLQNARAFAVLILSEPHAEDRLPELRAALAEPEVTATASALPGRLILRALSPDAWPLRRQMARLIEILRPGCLPRVWQS